MECSCSCDIDDPYPEFHDKREPRARKQHRCCECGEFIEPGDRYQKVTGKWDGDIVCYKTCLTCVRIRSDLCSQFAYGELRETIWECMGFDYVTGDDQDDDC